MLPIVTTRGVMRACQRTAPRTLPPRATGRQSIGRLASTSARPSYHALPWRGFAAATAASALVAYVALRQNAVHCDERKPAGTQPLPDGRKRSVPDISHLDAAILDDASQPMRKRMETYVKLLQHSIVTALGAEETDGNFLVDSWLRPEGGEGISCVLQDGETFEKAGVNISIVHGMLPPRAIAQMSADHGGLVERVGYKLEGADAEVKGLPFYATGLSLVVHPRNPWAPTVHFNYRYFELTHPPTLADGSPNPRYDPDNQEPVAWWFGGGTDLTPMFLFEDDATHFHRTLKAAADAHDAACYPAWKRWCDRYFWIPHRGEARGVGGIFFDDLTLPSARPGEKSRLPLRDGTKARPGEAAKPTTVSSEREHDRESLFRLVRSLGDAYLPAYLPILRRRHAMDYDVTQQRWQALRRGRYVEFNLLEDRGTKFGLQTPGARIESILMSLPLHARWEYLEPYSGVGKDGVELTQEQKAQEAHVADAELKRRIMEVLRRPKDWV